MEDRIPTKPAVPTRPPHPDPIPQIPAGTESQPLEITKGGTYSGDFHSPDFTPVVKISTSEPIVFNGGSLSGKGSIFQSTVPNVNIRVLNVTATGLYPDRFLSYPGRFFDAINPFNVEISGCNFTQTSGIELSGGSGAKIRILGNKVGNIDGRKSDGQGGFLRGKIPNVVANDPFFRVQFVQLALVRDCDCEIAYNDVMNVPGMSRVEDNVSIWRSSGTSKTPIYIHDNWIDGAYGSEGDPKPYSGGGILCGDGAGPNVNRCPAFVRCESNVVLNTDNYGIAIAAGHDIAIGADGKGNFIYSPNASGPNAVGIYCRNFGNDGDATWGRNSVVGNSVWLKRGSGRSDTWLPNATSQSGNSSLHTLPDLVALRNAWIQACQGKVNLSA